MSELLGIARFRFHEGKSDEYLRRAEQADALVAANEPGTLQYDLFINERNQTASRRRAGPDSGAT